jgi:pSer/pThr/pTyr-binding forkhead associated (FHA) protein
MPAKLTLYLPERPSRHVGLGSNDTAVLGRDPSADIVVPDPRVSRSHARFTWRDGRCFVADAGSKNGTFVNGSPASNVPLSDHDWLSFGGVVARFDLLTDGQALTLRESHALAQTTVDRLRRGEPDASCLLLPLLRSAMQLTSAERGFILGLGAGGIRPEVASGFSRAPLDGEPFAGSSGAIERALATGTSIVISDAQVDGFFANRQSVIDMSLATVACVPLRGDSGPVGLLYVDGRRTLDGFTELDLQILEAIADQAALVLAAMRLRGDVKALERSLRVPVPLPPDFRRRIGELATDAGLGPEPPGCTAVA